MYCTVHVIKEKPLTYYSVEKNEVLGISVNIYNTISCKYFLHIVTSVVTSRGGPWVRWFGGGGTISHHWPILPRKVGKAWLFLDF